MNVLVTGATGFVGSAIVEELSRNSINFLSVTSSAKKAEELKMLPQKNAGEILVADISSEESLSALKDLKNIDGVIHSAGLAHQFGNTKREAFDAVNVEGTRNVTNLAVALRVKHFILISSTAIYANETVAKKSSVRAEKFTAIDEESPLKPQTFYAQSKLEAEKVCVEICEKNDLPLTILRLAPVIGEANVGNVARLIETIDRNRFVWIGKGENYKSLIYKRDVAKACVEVLKKKTGKTEIFNLAAQPIQMKTFVNEIAEKLGRKIYKVHIPANLPRKIFLLNSKFVGNKRIAKIGATIEKWLADDVYVAEKIKARYDFEPPTSIADGLERQIEWYRKQR